MTPGATSWDQLSQRAAAFSTAQLQERFGRTKFALHGACRNFSNVHGYEPDDEIGLNFDTAFMSCTNGWTCGNMYAPAEEVNDFVWALYGPEAAIVSPASVAAMTTIWPGQDGWYGLGTMSLPGFRPGSRYCRRGHLGVTYGYSASASYNAALGYALTWGTNQEDPGQTATHGVVYDFLLVLDCKLHSVVLQHLYNEMRPLNCSPAVVNYEPFGCAEEA